MGMVADLATALGVKFLTPIPWTWYFVIGTIASFEVGRTAGQIVKSALAPKPQERGVAYLHLSNRRRLASLLN